ncbi:MAG TPA: enoyl-CoA hydratase/isomerase family protein [candidate division Zixibacteria bacterium]|nr:enoyl-CoA hydratase/isomerase family protein [candidate division Zixibacteria bacterium]MDD4917121.1 enoyl-CoA hydratase/isomerase family protein [candidate division Zixibacteria bacterium]MDM7972695.1 enoyl-CoA hydratase/isomerase family protein [candidate division Zixibacteria bacterium]HOD65390.1 enoyl-CoA hydratase/isomerase family protein [candidate division Zixibacteria bacterium]HOZ07879.1 enoyl-CoA hydratase/isomerase family protein [candidate division Zixibacteria bacterium]
MDTVDITTSGSLAVVTLQRGKVNAVNGDLVDRLRAAFRDLEADPAIRSVILTGRGSFFSFGLDVPELYDLPPDDFAAFLRNFTDLCRGLFLFPKPLVAAINGHAIAGGCILATACDRRVMATGKPRISLNELTFGSTVFQTAVELMRYWIGSRHAEEVLFGGRMYTAEEARAIGLVDLAAAPERPGPSVGNRSAASEFEAVAFGEAARLGEISPDAFAQAKSMLRRPVIDLIVAREEATIKRFVEIWYTPEIRASLRRITIRQ